MGSGNALRQIDIDTREGSWMSVDVTPHGDTLAFDLLGDVYVVPVGGGAARRLTTPPDGAGPASSGEKVPPSAQGAPFDGQPRFSPGGERIAFISDRSGSDALWVMRTDGTGLRRISEERGVVLSSPAWSPDGARIAVRRSTAQGTGELWTYPTDGDGPPRQLTDAGRLADIQGPTYAADGERIYVAAAFEVGDSRPLRRETWQIGRVNPATGAVTQVTARSGGAVRPQVAPGGDTLAYATWADERASLVLRDLQAGTETVLAQGVERNLQDMYLSHLDLFPGYAFGPDGRSLFVSYGGRLRRIAVPGGRSRVVSFRAQTTLGVPSRPRAKVRLPDTMTVRMTRWPEQGPEGERVVFEAVGRIWTCAQAPPGRPAQPLTDPSTYAVQPSLSPGGQWVAFVGWPGMMDGAMDGAGGAPDATGEGHVFKMPVEGGRPVQLTQEAGDYARPVWAPDGEDLAVLRSDSAIASVGERQLVLLPAAGGAPRPVATVTAGDAGVTFGAEGERLWYTSADGTLRSVRRDGSGRRAHLAVPEARRVVPSPGAERVAVACDNRVFTRELEARSASRVDTLRACAEQRPYAKAPGRPGYFPAWTSERTWTWAFGGAFFQKEVGAGASPARINLRVRVPVSRAASGRVVALKGARVIPMTGKGVIEEGTIVVRGNRIAAVGRAGAVDVPPKATVVDASGQTIMPGLIDVHQHALALLGGGKARTLPRSFGPSAALLAYGVTATRDPALLSNLRDFSMIELVNSGRALGPRYLATGERLMPEDYKITSLDDAEAAVSLQKELGATYIKSYLQPMRFQRQLLAEAAREQEVMITLEGGYDYKTVVTGLLDGYTGTEHSAGNHAVYGGFTQLAARTGTFYVPTILSMIGAEHYFRRSDVLGNAKLRRFISEGHLQKLADRRRRGQGVPAAETSFEPLTENVRRVVEAGGTVGVGAHDQPAPTGLGTHWEMWSFVEGGLSPKQALRAATRSGARLLGVSDQLGTLEAGKRADLLILNRNPLDNIRHSTALDRVMKGGLLYDADTAAPVRPAARSDVSSR
jgi:Tol biopolymer transport system component